MRFLMPAVILGTFFLVTDRGFNHGRATLELAEAASDASDWAMSGAGRIARTFTSFRA